MNSFGFFLDMLPLPEAIQVPVRRYFEPDPAYLINLLRPVIEERKRTPSNVSVSVSVFQLQFSDLQRYLFAFLMIFHELS